MTKKMITVMISSRCNDRFPSQGDASLSLTEIRLQLKDAIENENVFGAPCFNVWINEDTPPQAGRDDSWEVCLKAARECDIFIALYNGHAGWARNTQSDIGICHAELQTALEHAPGKVFPISIAEKDHLEHLRQPINVRFQRFVDAQNLFRGGSVHDLGSLTTRVRETMREAMVFLTKRGVREASRGRYHMGEALDWSRRDFAGRQHAIASVIRAALLERANTTKLDSDKGAVALIGNKRICLAVSAIPAALTVPAAREMVGQPFLKDYQFQDLLASTKSKGPVHVVGCHRAITEPQALRLLGFPDATVVSAPFGVYVVDDVQKIQMVLIANCRDETTTRHGVQRFFEWLEQTGEGVKLAARATSRANIVRVLAAECGSSAFTALAAA